METSRPVAPDVSIPPLKRAAVPVTASAAAAAAVAVASTGHGSNADHLPPVANSTTGGAKTVFTSQESDMSASSGTSCAPPLASCQSNLSAESVVDTARTSPATSNGSMHCPSFGQPLVPAANEEDHVQPPAMVVTTQPATATTSGSTRNTSPGSPRAVAVPVTASYGTKRTASGAAKLLHDTSASPDVDRQAKAREHADATGRDGMHHASRCRSSVDKSAVPQLSTMLKTRLTSAMATVRASAKPHPAKPRNPHYAFDRHRRQSAVSDRSDPDPYLVTPCGTMQGSPPRRCRSFSAILDFDSSSSTDDDDDEGDRERLRRAATRSSTASAFNTSYASPAPSLATAPNSSPKRHRRSASNYVASAIPGSQPRAKVDFGPFMMSMSTGNRPAPPAPVDPRRSISMQQDELEAAGSLISMRSCSQPHPSANRGSLAQSSLQWTQPSAVVKRGGSDGAQRHEREFRGSKPTQPAILRGVEKQVVAGG